MSFHINDSDNLSSSQNDSQQQQLQNETITNLSSRAQNTRYNISNVLKYIHSLKYGQRSASNFQNISNTNNENSTTGGGTSMINLYSSSASSLPVQTSTASSFSSSSAAQLPHLSDSLGVSSGSAKSKQFWMPDDQVKECYDCNSKFTTIRRRHVKK
jgi:hypothetical protein